MAIDKPESESTEDLRKEVMEELKRLEGRVDMNALRGELNRRAISNVGHKVANGAATAGRETAKLAVLLSLAIVSPKDMLNKLYDRLDGGSGTSSGEDQDDEEA